MKVLVTGSAGFVGQRLVRELAKAGHKVVAASRQPEERLPATVPFVPFRIDSPLETVDWRPALHGVDAVVHAAGLAHRANLAEHEFHRVNCVATHHLYASASAAGVGRFVFVSSLAAVTSRSLGWITRDTPSAPTTPYGRSKAAAEMAVIDGRKQGGSPYTLLRPPMLYGRGNPGNMARLLRLIQWGVPLPFDALRNRRSFLFIDSFCDIVARLLTAPATADGVYFPSDDDDVSTPELIRALAAATGQTPRLWSVPAPWFEAWNRRRPDSLLAKLTGSLHVDSAPLWDRLRWQPTVSLRDAVQAAFSSP